MQSRTFVEVQQHFAAIGAGPHHGDAVASAGMLYDDLLGTTH